MNAKMPRVLLMTIAVMGFFNSSICQVPTMKISYVTIYFNQTTFLQFTDCLEKKYSQCTVKYHYKRYEWVRAFVNYTKFSQPRNIRATNAYYSCVATSTHKVVDSVKYDELKCRFKTLSRCEVFSDTCRSYFAAVLWRWSKDYLVSKDIGNCSSLCVGVGNLVLYEKITSKQEIPTIDLSRDNFIVNFETNDYTNNDDSTTLDNTGTDTTTIISSSDNSSTVGSTANDLLDPTAKDTTSIDTTTKDTTPINSTAKHITPIDSTAKDPTTVNSTTKDTTPINSTAKDNTPIDSTAKDPTTIISKTHYSTTLSSIDLKITNPDITSKKITLSYQRETTSPNIFYTYTVTNAYETSHSVTLLIHMNRIQQDNRRHDNTTTIAGCVTGVILLSLSFIIGFIVWRRKKRTTSAREQNQNVDISVQVLTDDTISCNETNVFLDQTDTISCNERNVLLDRTTYFNSNDEADFITYTVDNEVHQQLITSADNQL